MKKLDLNGINRKKLPVCRTLVSEYYHLRTNLHSNNKCEV